ncbi:MAG: ATP-dependent DNA helicase RecG [Candidatus Brennerbacteria bacterium CG11_big_fil_rev_8_21_14_0_20_43_10]|uniref:Probable DNA 3'-5' helicase RecG n=3 Tax=Candidatus Brenneribacteriota TaxID=1817902 RepID=A0A2M8C3J1_9BACT|nr:MAG: hypothetical protein AUJ43_01910 [Parcubacteria group bacterium CG1_02_44_31]PIP50218.1 MAG: ATP-dependent DNA helicase RecG [Candidatus Brennerbacteria bacterium CG23_combo_of_CG06-09_8_20_14_all_44_41]PIR26251.1 MAG: ATP-dependent DNA helicase RecG [Candidatus Brennerbacteria bacterium CG11_big_fil_rev_8_21_14_0_20_43_10]PIX29017.1 MAG: DNA helicase RecG [Candidatus Brennerbacteria bacterium CG_4_8_14_3_um_filter_43_14]PJA19368.1 MAG: DNA helicase RecG [Candidatus Brennerbacteria bact
MDAFFEQSISDLKGVGAYYVKKLAKLGIKTVWDLLWHFPNRYEDFSNFVSIRDIREPGVYSTLGIVEKIKTRRAWHKRMFITEGVLYDKTGAIDVIWFGQPYLARSIPQGCAVVVSGKVVARDNKILFQSPAYEVIERHGRTVSAEELKTEDLKHTAGLIPVYPETRGLTSRGIRFLIKPLLGKIPKTYDSIPKAVLRSVKLMPFDQAMREIHFPQSVELAAEAKRRFAFEELFVLQTTLLQYRKQNQTLHAPEIKQDIEFIKRILASLPFELTKTQKQAAWDIIKDISNPYPMNRLLNGDVGSGKTIVAALGIAATVHAGYQAVVLAPTEILARQHFEKLSKIFEPFAIETALLVSHEARITSEGLHGAITKQALKTMLRQDKSLCVIGTHAVIQKDVLFSNLALVIVDEQHRFGVNQRAALLHNSNHTHTPELSEQDVRQSEKILHKELHDTLENHSGSLGRGMTPHFLSMSATPIPRTLALALWGDLDISFIRELPQGRKKIISKVLFDYQREELYAFIKKQVSDGRQAFVICPRIEKPDEGLSEPQYLALDTKAVLEEYEKLSKIVFPDLRVGLLHGKLKSELKEDVMKKFSQGELDVLVSTSVVEVGVDIPNAAVMVIEGADRFGLAQLHQFRGRVGRGAYQSYCFLLSSLDAGGIQKRLQGFAKAFDGFKLAEQDLQIRGPGEFFGVKQSGIPDLAMHSLRDIELVMCAHTYAEAILKKDATLESYPMLQERIKEFKTEIHLE